EGTDMTLFFDAGQTLPQGEICVTKINILPDAWPAVNAGDTVSSAYWVVHLFDNNQNAALWSMHFENLALPTGQPAEAYALWQRPATADGDTWQVRDTADLAIPGAGSVLSFFHPLNVSTLGQYILTMPADSLPTVAVQEKPVERPDLRVYPNPLVSGQTLHLRSNLEEDVRFVLFDSAGRRIMERTFRGQDAFVPSSLPAGQYFYRLQTEKVMVQGGLQVVE
ncbi:MAG: T9SS type A sorting domain-containing protein, partial [Saprospiraceae bacterium]|nr:T9SS type A sorting domain-containing protein [Saprospiraceae bacterium]